MDSQQVNLREDKFSPIPTFLRTLSANPRIALSILVFGFLPSFGILLASVFIPEPTKNFWFYLNASTSSFFSVLLSYLVGRQLIRIFREGVTHRISLVVVIVLATVSLLVNGVLTFLPTFIEVPLVVEAILPILSTYATFVVLNVATSYVDSGRLETIELGEMLKAINKRIGYGFAIGLSLFALLFAAMVPVLLISIFQTFLLFNKIYFYFFISLLIPTFSSIFFLSYLRKEYYAPPKRVDIRA